jgi:hypothetical protein
MVMFHIQFSSLDKDTAGFLIICEVRVTSIFFDKEIEAQNIPELT